MSYKIGVDVGGTFTDIVIFNDKTNDIYFKKVPSTPGKPEEGILNGVRDFTSHLEIKHEEIDLFAHGTTVATNSIIERKGSKTALIVTEGFKDIMVIGRQDRPKLYDFFMTSASGGTNKVTGAVASFLFGASPTQASPASSKVVNNFNITGGVIDQNIAANQIIPAINKALSTGQARLG